MGYVEVRNSIIFKVRLVINCDNPTISKDRLTETKARNLHMKLELLTGANHGTLLHIGCDCGACF